MTHKKSYEILLEDIKGNLEVNGEIEKDNGYNFNATSIYLHVSREKMLITDPNIILAIERQIEKEFDLATDWAELDENYKLDN